MMLSPHGAFGSFVSFANQLQAQGIGNLSQMASVIQQSQAAALQQLQQQPKELSSAPRKTRVGGTTLKTAKVWKYFDQLPPEEQAAECQLCRKKIKATNSSTTGMIRHLRSCHVNEYQALQEARQSSLIVKMELAEEKARAQLLRDMGDKGSRKAPRSPASAISASDTASLVSAAPSFSSSSSTASSSIGFAPPPAAFSALTRPFLPAGLPAPKPILPTKVELTEEEDDQPCDLSVRPTPAFASVQQLIKPSAREGKTRLDGPVDDTRINTQIAIMLLLDAQPASVVDRPGFRSLIKLIAPSYRMPLAAYFEAEIIPDLVQTLTNDIRSQFALNNPFTPSFDSSAFRPSGAAAEGDANPVKDENMQTAEPFTGLKETSGEERDSDSSSSADSETALPARIDSLLNHIGKYVFPHEEVMVLLTLCRAVFSHFEERPQAVSEIDCNLPPRDPARPDLARDVAFIAQHYEAINEYLRSHPEFELSPLSDYHIQFIKDLNAHIQAI